jgi:hypothetical protein
LEVLSELESGYRLRQCSSFASGAMLKLAWLATGCLLHRVRFSPMIFFMGPVVVKVAVGQILL